MVKKKDILDKKNVEKVIKKAQTEIKKDADKVFSSSFFKKAKNAIIKILCLLLDFIRHFNLLNFKVGNCTIKLNKHGRNIIIVFMVACFLSLLATGVGFLTTTLLFLTFFTMWFFRDPERILPDKKNVVIAPCDGQVLKIETSSLPEELCSNDKSEYTKISTFMNITDMHVQRMPVDCKVKQVEYVKGVFLNASLDKASKDNERNYVLIEANNGDTMCITQIAGFIARRIVCDVKKNELCKIGERFGCIKFGSRIELYIPKRYKVEVLAGQRLICGETIVASFDK